MPMPVYSVGGMSDTNNVWEDIWGVGEVRRGTERERERLSARERGREGKTQGDRDREIARERER
jgi:hypothetical protein